MATMLPRPTTADVRDALVRCRPDLTDAPITYFAEGWDFWAFSAGDYVLRLPKAVDRVATLEKEQRLLPTLAAAMPVAIPSPDLYCDDGPNGLPFAGHRLIPGVPLRELSRLPAAGFGAELGRFLRALHRFPLDTAAALGLPVHDPASLRDQRIETYERFVRVVFPVLSCEARSYTKLRFESYLNNSASFAYVPCLVHFDIDERNTLVDPETGALTGVIDFGDAHIGDPAGDFTWPLLGGFASIGVEDQLPDFLREAGVKESDVRKRCEFYKFCWPMHEIFHGIEIDDAGFVEEAIRSLNAAVPRDLRCD